MRRHVAVQVQYPRVSYVDLFPLRGRQRSQRRLAPIEIDQRVAVVKLFLMRSSAGAGAGSSGQPTPERLLHTFRVGTLPTGADTASLLTLDGEYDGARTVRFRIAGGGSSSQTAEVRVPRPRRWWVLWALLGVLLLGIGLFGVFNSIAPSQRGTPRDATVEATESPDEPSPPRGGSVGGEDTPTGENIDNRAEAALDEDSPISSDATPDESVSAGETPGADVDAVADPQVEPPLPRTEAVVYFEPNRTRLTDHARRELDELASVLRSHPEVPVTIIGHTALYGTEEGRMEISQGRAQGVASYLRSRGWDPATEPSIEWVGSQNPVTRDRDEQQRNRRVQVSIGENQSSR